jgi:hypothetical protein
MRNSFASIRIQTGKSAPARCLTARIVSHSRRARFSSGPPQASSRWFQAAERKEERM